MITQNHLCNVVDRNLKKRAGHHSEGIESAVKTQAPLLGTSNRQVEGGGSRAKKGVVADAARMLVTSKGEELEGGRTSVISKRGTTVKVLLTGRRRGKGAGFLDKTSGRNRGYRADKGAIK